MKHPYIHITNSKKPTQTGHVVSESNKKIFWRSKTRVIVKRLVSARVRRGEENREQRIFRVMKLFCKIPKWWSHIIIHFSKPTECITPCTTPNINYEIQVIMMY